MGNFVFPALAENPNLFIFACDFSKRAVDMVKENEQYDESRCKAFVCDLTNDDLTENIEPESLDLVRRPPSAGYKGMTKPIVFFQGLGYLCFFGHSS